MDYQTHQRRLMPILATAYGLTFARDELVDMFVETKKGGSSASGGGGGGGGGGNGGGGPDPQLVADVHALSAGLKAWTTSYTAKALNTCRETCGGHGFSANNRFGAWRSDHDVFQTFEGDNIVLLQQVSTLLLKEYGEKFRSGSALQVTFSYLKDTVARAVPHNPLLTHDVSAKSIRNHAQLLRTMNVRTARLLQTVAARLAARTREVSCFKKKTNIYVYKYKYKINICCCC